MPQECLDPDDEGEPEVLPAARRRGQADQPVPRRQQHPARRPERGRSGQRARRAPAPGRCQVLLRPGPQEDARIARRRGSTRSSTTASWAARATRVQRVRAIARAIAERTRRSRRSSTRPTRAALLAKADLLTDMVGEFPELQGIMGGYYARARRPEAPEVADAIEDHYKPRFAGDAAAAQPRRRWSSRSPTSSRRWSALFGIGQLPTGDKDPFALRRHALGVIRDAGRRAGARPPDLRELLAHVVLDLRRRRSRTGVVDDVEAFIYERSCRQLCASRATRAHEVDAVLGTAAAAPARRARAARSRCAPSPRCPRRRRWRRPTSASATS